jgi:hypothetical protein
MTAQNDNAAGLHRELDFLPLSHFITLVLQNLEPRELRVGVEEQDAGEPNGNRKPLPSVHVAPSELAMQRHAVGAVLPAVDANKVSDLHVAIGQNLDDLPAREHEAIAGQRNARTSSLGGRAGDQWNDRRDSKHGNDRRQELTTLHGSLLCDAPAFTCAAGSVAPVERRLNSGECRAGWAALVIVRRRHSVKVLAWRPSC